MCPVWKVGKPSRFSEASLSLTVQCGSCAANTRSTGVDGEEQQGPTSEGWCPHCGQRGQKAQTALWLDMAMSLDCITCESRGSKTQAASDLVFFSSALLLSLPPPSRWKIWNQRKCHQPWSPGFWFSSISPQPGKAPTYESWGSLWHLETAPRTDHCHSWNC